MLTPPEARTCSMDFPHRDQWMPSRRLRPCGLSPGARGLSVVLRLRGAGRVTGHASPLSWGRCSATRSRGFATWPESFVAGCDSGSAHGIRALRSLAPGDAKRRRVSTHLAVPLAVVSRIGLDGLCRGADGRGLAHPPRGTSTGHPGGSASGHQLRGQGAPRAGVRSGGETHYCPGLSLLQVCGCRWARRRRSRLRRRPSGAGGAHVATPIRSWVCRLVNRSCRESAAS